MVTVGYGDVYPVNNNEILYTMILMLLTCGVFSYIVSEILDIFKHIKHTDNQIREDMYLIK